MADTYTILSVGATQELGPTGNLADVMEVQFETIPPGGTGTVRVPKTAGWREAMEAAVAKEAADMLALLQG